METFHKQHPIGSIINFTNAAHGGRQVAEVMAHTPLGFLVRRTPDEIPFRVTANRLLRLSQGPWGYRWVPVVD